MALRLDDSITQIFCASGMEITKVVRKSDGVTLWEKIPPIIVLFDTNDNGIETRRWYREAKPNNKWGTANCQTNKVSDTWNVIDCTDYKYCTVRIKGNVESTPSGATVNHTYIKIGFTDKYTEAVEVVDRWTNDSGGSGQSGLAYNKWYDLELDISNLTGVQTLNVFIGGAIYENGGYLHCSKITLHN